MKIYLVGGAVRDQLLHVPVKEKDWVVVGATVDDMLQQGFRPVGKDFPVFLHPETNEEYALARTERKVGRGYTGFDVEASPEVTLEEDLMRRDLTINAMAQTTDGELIDLYQGREDLENKLLRHVSPAFIEDPVRILRIARFAARFSHLGFKVAEETDELMRQMVASGEVDALVAERVWKELERALCEKNPEQFFQVLTDCGALAVLFPEINPENMGLQALLAVAKVTSNSAVRWAALLHDLEEGAIKTLCERLRAPAEYRELALLVARHFSVFQRGHSLSAAEIVNLLQAVDAFRREARFKKFLLASESAFIPHRLVESTLELPLFSTQLLRCYDVAKKVDAKLFLTAGFAGKELAEQICQKRISTVNEFLIESSQALIESSDGSKKIH